MLDWGKLCQPPCYVAAVHNLRPAARCAAEALGSLRKAGLRPDRLTCVGHSLGAHMCGIIANYLTFRLNRIIGKYLYLPTGADREYMGTWANTTHGPS